MNRVELGQLLTGPWASARQVFIPESWMVATWFLHAPGQGLGYDKFLLSVADLDAAPDLPAQARRYPHARYRLLVVSLHPGVGPTAADPDTWRHMLPVNVDIQFHGVDRQRAAAVARHAAESVTQGTLPAETQVYVEERPAEVGKMVTVASSLAAWRLAVGDVVNAG